MNLTENAVRITPHVVERLFLDLALSSDTVQQQFYDKTNQLGQPKLAIKRIESTLIPLPPLAEQKRIVAKVDELLAHCAALERKLGQAQVASRQLTAAVLQGVVG